MSKKLLTKQTKKLKEEELYLYLLPNQTQ